MRSITEVKRASIWYLGSTSAVSIHDGDISATVTSFRKCITNFCQPTTFTLVREAKVVFITFHLGSSSMDVTCRWVCTQAKLTRRDVRHSGPTFAQDEALLSSTPGGREGQNFPREDDTFSLFLFSSLIPSMLCSLKVTVTSSISHEHRVSFSLMVANPVEQARKLNSKSSEFKSFLERSAPKYLL